MATVREKVEEYLGRLNSHEVADTDGRATAKLAARVKVPVTALYPALKRMEHDGQIYRNTHGKRTYAIRLKNVDLEPDPAPPANGNGAVVRSPKLQEQLDAVATALEEHGGLLEENERLQKELGKAERTIEAQSLEIAALKRTVSTERILKQIQEKLAELA